MEKVIKIYILMFAMAAGFFFMAHPAVVSDQQTTVHGRGRYVVPPAERVAPHPSVQDPDRDLLLKLLVEDIEYLESVKALQAKVYRYETALYAEILKENPDRSVIAEISGVLTAHRRKMNAVTSRHQRKLNKIRLADGEYVIGRGPVLPPATTPYGPDSGKF